jgi:hypothetical protein
MFHSFSWVSRVNSNYAHTLLAGTGQQDSNYSISWRCSGPIFHHTVRIPSDLAAPPLVPSSKRPPRILPRTSASAEADHGWAMAFATSECPRSIHTHLCLYRHTEIALVPVQRSVSAIACHIWLTERDLQIWELTEPNSGQHSQASRKESCAGHNILRNRSQPPTVFSTTRTRGASHTMDEGLVENSFLFPPRCGAVLQFPSGEHPWGSTRKDSDHARFHTLDVTPMGLTGSFDANDHGFKRPTNKSSYGSLSAICRVSVTRAVPLDRHEAPRLHRPEHLQG